MVRLTLHLRRSNLHTVVLFSYFCWWLVLVGGSGLPCWSLWGSDCPCFQLTGILLFSFCLGLTHDSRWRRRLGLFRLLWNWDEPPLYSYLCWCLFEQFHEQLCKTYSCTKVRMPHQSLQNWVAWFSGSGIDTDSAIITNKCDELTGMWFTEASLICVQINK